MTSDVLTYGLDCQVELGVCDSRSELRYFGPQAYPDIDKRLARLLEQPLELPPLRQAIVSSDRIVIALDPGTPQGTLVIREICKVLDAAGVAPKQVLILQPVSLMGGRDTDPRLLLNKRWSSEVEWKIHDATDPQAIGYLASTVGGERIYLAKDLLEADFVMTVGTIEFDSVLGYRGAGSALYPGLSDVQAITRSLGQGHLELGPDDERPLRQVVDEVSWLLGVQFSVQVLPGPGTQGSEIYAGLDTAVFQQGCRLLKTQRLIPVAQRVPSLLLAIDHDAGGYHWEQIGRALATARNLVTRGGKVIVLTDLAEPPGEGFQILRNCEKPSDAIKLLRHEIPMDVISATQVASTVDWAEVYLLSRQDPTLVDELFMTPIESPFEALRLFRSESPRICIGGAQHSFGCVTNG